MKRFILVFVVFLIFFSMLVLFASQPPELRILFKDKGKQIAENGLQRQQPVSFEPKVEIRKGVHIVKSLPEFLYIYLKHAKQVFIKMCPDHNVGLREYQDVATSVGDKAVFMSIDSSKESNLVELFKLLLKAQGVVPPVFLVCQKGFVLMPKVGVLSFNKACLQILRPKKNRITTEQVLLYINNNGGKQPKVAPNKETRDSVWGKIKRLFQ
jgi:hypothetical protein